jgi:hypothetical protein
MDLPTERHREGIQSASVAFVSILTLGVVAAGFLLSTESTPNTTSSSTVDRVLGSGPISSFPASWADLCGNLVSGNETTSGTNLGPDSFLTANNLTLSQVYSKIVSSSTFQRLAAGRSWVTLYWGLGQLTNRTASYPVVTAQFLFVSGGIPDPDGLAEMEYYVGPGEVAGGISMWQASCAQGTAFRVGATLAPLSALNYTVGQPVQINFTFTNFTNASMTITARTSCLGNFTVIQGGPLGTISPTYGAAVYNSAEHPDCTGLPLDVVLNPFKSYSQTVEWDQTYDNGTQVPPGDYWITGMEAGYLGQTFPVIVVEGPLMISDQTLG